MEQFLYLILLCVVDIPYTWIGCKLSILNIEGSFTQVTGLVW